MGDIYEVIFHILKEKENARLKSMTAKARKEFYVELESLASRGSPTKIQARNEGEFYTVVLTTIPPDANCFCRIRGPQNPHRYDFIVQFYQYHG